MNTKLIFIQQDTTTAPASTSSDKERSNLDDETFIIEEGEDDDDDGSTASNLSPEAENLMRSELALAIKREFEGREKLRHQLDAMDEPGNFKISKRRLHEPKRGNIRFYSLGVPS